MTVIGISTSSRAKVRRYRHVVEKLGADPLPLRPHPKPDIDRVLNEVDGLILSGGEDIDPVYYNDPPENSSPDQERDAFEIPLVTTALERDMPIFGICRGMEALNVVLGGKLIQNISGHRTHDRIESEYHDVYVAPGSRLGRILGGGPVMKVNSRHRQGFNHAIKAPGLLASCYVLDGDLIEGVEAPEYSWVVAVQWHPEREDEVPARNMNLFQGLIEAAERMAATAR